MKSNFDYLIERYLGVLQNAVRSTADEPTRNEFQRHIDAAKQHLLTWRLNGRLEDLRERLQDEQKSYRTADRDGRLAAAEVHSVAEEFGNLCRAAGMETRLTDPA